MLGRERRGNVAGMLGEYLETPHGQYGGEPQGGQPHRDQPSAPTEGRQKRCFRQEIPRSTARRGEANRTTPERTTQRAVMALREHPSHRPRKHRHAAKAPRRKTAGFQYRGRRPPGAPCPYFPSSRRMNDPEMPGRIMALIATTPDRNIRTPGRRLHRDQPTEYECRKARRRQTPRKFFGRQLRTRQDTRTTEADTRPKNAP